MINCILYKKNCHVLIELIMGDSLEDSNGDTWIFPKKMWMVPSAPITLQKGINWEVLGGRYICKFGVCKISFATKWFFCRHVEKNHFLIMLTSRYSHLSTCEKGPRHKDHMVTNVFILGNPYKCHKQNEAKAMDCV